MKVDAWTKLTAIIGGGTMTVTALYRWPKK